MPAIPVPSRRPAPDPDDRMATAIHESGHAVCALALGSEVTCLTLDAGCDGAAQRLGLCRTRRGEEPNGWWATAVTALAGPHAEQKFARYPFGTLAMMWGSAWQQDRRNAQHWLGLIRVVTLAQAEAMARHLVDRDWSAILRVAEALASEGELSGAALDRLWRE
jgi:hypothetical protein